MKTSNKLLTDFRKGDSKGVVDIHLCLQKIVEIFEDDWEEVEEGEV